MRKKAVIFEVFYQECYLSPDIAFPADFGPYEREVTDALGRVKRRSVRTTDVDDLGLIGLFQEGGFPREQER